MDFKNTLACPACKGSLESKKESLTCKPCKAVYPLVKGVPIFLSGVTALEPSRAFSYEERVAKALRPIWPLYALARLIYPPEAYWTRPLKRVYEQLNGLLGRTKEYSILEIGGGIQSDGRKYLRPEINDHIVNLDINYNENVDVLGDAHHLPFKDGAFDAVMVQSVLEHVADPALVVAEIHRVLKKNGLVYAMIPFVQGYHSYPGDYQRYTHEGLQELFKHFKLVKSDVALGPASAFVMNTVYFFESFFDTEILKSVTRFVLRWLLFPVRYFDLYLLRKNSRNIIPAAVYYIGSKERVNEKDLTHKVVKIFQHEA